MLKSSANIEENSKLKIEQSLTIIYGQITRNEVFVPKTTQEMEV